MKNQIVKAVNEPKVILFKKKKLEERFYETYNGGENNVIFGMSILKADKKSHIYEGEIDCGFYRSHKFLGFRVSESESQYRFNEKWIAELALGKTEKSCFCFDFERDKPQKTYEFFIGSKEKNCYTGRRDLLFQCTNYVLTTCYIMRGLLEYNPDIPPASVKMPTRIITSNLSKGNQSILLLEK